MKENKFFAIVMLMTVMFFTACDKDDDTADVTPPQIRILSPADGEEVVVGSTILFQAEFTDNVAVSSYKINIHNNFDEHGHSHNDGHTHAAPDNHEEEHETKHFEFNRFWNLQGEMYVEVIHREIEIPENATPGEYHFMVYSTDQAGNETYVVKSIVLVP